MLQVAERVKLADAVFILCFFDTSCRQKCWNAEYIVACEGLRVSDRYIDCVKAAIPLSLQDFVIDP